LRWARGVSSLKGLADVSQATSISSPKDGVLSHKALDSRASTAALIAALYLYTQPWAIAAPLALYVLVAASPFAFSSAV
jgi:hypothetical protein